MIHKMICSHLFKLINIYIISRYGTSLCSGYIEMETVGQIHNIYFMHHNYVFWLC